MMKDWGLDTKILWGFALLVALRLLWPALDGLCRSWPANTPFWHVQAPDNGP